VDIVCKRVLSGRKY